MKRLQLALGLLLTLLAPAFTYAQQDAADTVAVNGKIYTSNPDQKWAEAIAIRGTDIVYVGDNEGAKKFVGKNTSMADLKGKSMMPGILATHEDILTRLGKEI